MTFFKSQLSGFFPKAVLLSFYDKQLVKEATWRYCVTLDASLGNSLGSMFLRFANQDFLDTGCCVELTINTVVEFIPSEGAMSWIISVFSS